MLSTRVRSGLAVVAIGVALFATLGEATKTSSSSGSNPAPNAGQTSAPSASSGTPSDPASTKTAPIPVGAEKQVAEGWTVKVNLANLNANQLLASTNQFNKPQPGETFVLINMTVANKSDKPASPGSNMKLSYLPPSGVAYDSYSCLVSAPDKLDTSAQMQPGATATGNVCFSVKTADIPNGLLLAEPQFTMDTVKDQQFFALS